MSERTGGWLTSGSIQSSLLKALAITIGGALVMAATLLVVMEVFTHRRGAETNLRALSTGTRTGVRAAVRWEPNDKFSITPRIVYQRVETDGWNRIDDFNILANPFTTTRPAVTLD